jgi:cell division protein FtsL
VWVFVGAVLVAGLLLILPLYMQNCLTKLYSKSNELAYEIGQLQRERTLQELEINKLSSLENLAGFADSVGLDLNGVPTKVRVTGAP